MYLIQQKQKKVTSDKAEHTKKIVINLPRTPEKLADAIQSLIDHATPTTAQALANRNLIPSSRLSAQSAITKASAASIEKDRKSKRNLANCLKHVNVVNKSAVARELKVSRTTLNRNTRAIRRGYTEEDRQKAREFFTDIEVAVCFPNKTNSQHPIYVLKCSATQVYALFKRQYPEIKMKLTTFWSLKPKYVRIQARSKMLQCTCDICENIELLMLCVASSMARHGIDIPEVMRRGSQQGSRSRRIGLATLCDKTLHNPACLDRQCPDCGVQLISNLLTPWKNDMPEVLKWLKWENVATEINNKTVNRLTKVGKTGTRGELVAELGVQLQSFGRHCFIERSQTLAYKDCISNFGADEVVVVVDYAENYTCLRQGEAQSAYYSRNQVTVHPMVASVFKDNKRIRDSVVILSDDLKHDAGSVYHMMQTFMMHIEVHYPTVRKIVVWSDGGPGHYKSAKPFYNVSKSFDSKRFSLVWNFFGSRHGKGSADGESAVVKSFLARQAQDPAVLIDSAMDAYTALCRSERHITDGDSLRHFYLLKAEDVVRQGISVNTIPGTRKLHQMIAGASPNTIIYRSLSCYCSGPCPHNQNEWRKHLLRGNLIKLFHIFLA